MWEGTARMSMPLYGRAPTFVTAILRSTHAAGIRVSAMPAYQLAPKGMALSSKL